MPHSFAEAGAEHFIVDELGGLRVEFATLASLPKAAQVSVSRQDSVSRVEGAVFVTEAAGALEHRWDMGLALQAGQDGTRGPLDKRHRHLQVLGTVSGPGSASHWGGG